MATGICFIGATSHVCSVSLSLSAFCAYVCVFTYEDVLLGDSEILDMFVSFELLLRLSRWDTFYFNVCMCA